MSSFSNLRRNPFTGAYSWRVMDTEFYTVAELAELPGIYAVQLLDRPKPASVTVTENATGGAEFVQVTTAPLAGQCRIDYTGGYIFFNVADDGADVAIDYEGGGTTMTIESLQALVTSPYGVDDVFVQWPISASNDIAIAFPAAQRPAARFGGTWVQIWDTDAVFFKTQGDFHASDGQNTNRTNGKQTHQGLAHFHNLMILDMYEAASGDLKKQPNTGGSDTGGYVNDAITDGTHGAALFGYENRPQNRIMLLWKRTA